MRSEKRHMAEGMELPSQDKIRRLRGKETYKYLGILETGTIKQADMKDFFLKLRESKLYIRNLFNGINTMVVRLQDTQDHS